MIVAQDLTKVYPGKRAIAGVSLAVRKGEIVGFLGPNGAGKTTTMRILTCFQPATSGTARVAGFDVFEQAEDVRRNIGYLPESPPLYLEMRVREYLEFVARIKGLPRSQLRARLADTVERCGLGDVQYRILGKLSKGYRQRAGLAQAVLHNPPILILDEPTSGLDPQQVVEVRVIIINQGRIVLSRALGELDGGNGTQVLLVELQAPQDVRAGLAGVDGVRGVEAVPGGSARRYRLECESGHAVRARVAAFVVAQGWKLLELRPQETSLEETYLRVVSADGGMH
jgi:ABC-2 type transport system ATP-binding protein